jgi:hypothetical protein
MSEPTDPKELTTGDAPVAGDDHRRRMRHDWQNLMDDLIEDGRQRGLFSDLAGQGRPLELEQNVYEGSAALANKLLKDNDLRPAWLAQRAGAAEKIDALRADVARTWGRYRTAFQQAQGESHRTALTLGWDDACRKWEEAIRKINKEIDAYNLKRPMAQLELFRLRLTDELKRVDAPRYLR